MKDQNFELIRRLTAAALWGTPLCQTKEEEEAFRHADWEAVLRLGGKLAVAAIAWQAVARLPEGCRPPFAIQLAWSLSAQRCQDEYAIRHTVLQALHDQLQAAGIGPVLLLKGETLAALYPDPSLRASGDIDIMPCRDFDASNRAIEALGIPVDYSNLKHSCFVFKGISIENHTPVPNPGFLRPNYRTDLLVQKAIQNGTLDEGPCGFRQLDPVTAALFTLNHFAQHVQMNEEVTLRMACDLELLLRKHPKLLRDWQEGLRFAGLQRFASVILRMLDLLFGDDREPFSRRSFFLDRDAKSLIRYYILRKGRKIQRMLIKYRYLPLPLTDRYKDLRWTVRHHLKKRNIIK